MAELRSTAQLEATFTTEKDCLGAAILERSGRQARILVTTLREDDFLSSLHRGVFRAIKQLVRRDDLPLSYNSIIAQLQMTGVFESYSNCYSYIAGLAEGCVLSRPMTKRTQLLRQLAAERRQAKKREQETP